MSRRILKWRLPVDDQWHAIPGRFQHCEVDLFDADTVWLWALENDLNSWEFRVYGTGHDLPDEMEWIGTARHDRTGLVWHVLARPIVDEVES